MRYLYFFIGLLIIVLVYFNIKAQKLNQSLSTNISQLEVLLNNERSLSANRDHFLRLSLKNNNTLIKNDLEIIDEKGKSFLLKDILPFPKLIFRYSELHCDVCVDQQIKTLKLFKEKIGSDNIIVLANYELLKNLILFKRLNALDIPVYKLSGRMNLELEENDTPYFFILDKNNVANDFFIPIKEINNYTYRYLNVMFEKYFKKEQ